MTATSLEISDLTAGYGPTRIIENLSLSVAPGARLAVLGRNGMGKTTLLATLAGQTRRYAGTIRLGNTELTNLSGSARALAGLGYVPQQRAIFKSLSVEENLLVGIKNRNAAAIEEAFAMFPRLKERRRNLGTQLSGGEQQMLTTARTLLGQPSVLLLDEPLEGLAPVICDELMEVFGEVAKSRSMTILLVEQRLQAALAFAEQVIVLERGRISWTGTPRQLSEDPETIGKVLGVSHNSG